jgi:CMP/dCMP kinase
MVITIDGPAGTGKSTVARAVAQQLGFDFLDTGAMYRAVGLAALRRGLDLNDTAALGELAHKCRVDFDWSAMPPAPPAVRLDGQRIGDELRNPAATDAASRVAVAEGVRQVLVEQQRQVGRERPNLVTEGRDQGSVVFPGAELKIYLTASPAVRARRRIRELAEKGQTPDYAAVLRDITERDARDQGRRTGPLKRPAGSVEIDTSDLTTEQVIGRIVTLAREVGEVRGNPVGGGR